MPVSAPPVGATSGAPAELPPASPAGRGMFGIHGTGDTSGFGGLVRRRPRVVEHARGRTAATSTRSYDALEEALPGLRRRDREGRRRPRRADPAHRPGADRRGLPGHARRRGAALRAVLLGVRCGLPRLRRAPAARRLPPHLDDLPAPGPAGGARSPPRTRTCRASPASTRPPTGRSGRRTTCSASSSTATRT